MPAPADADAAAAWTDAWLGRVADGSSTMSQRRLSTVKAKGGGLDALRPRAEARGLHLLVVVDDEGHEVVAASTRPFRVLC